MTRPTALAAGICVAAALSLTVATSAGAQAYVVEEAYAAAPPPILDLAPPPYVPSTVYVAPARAHTRRIYVAPDYYYVAPSRRVIVIDRNAAPAHVGGHLDADW